jgi:iron complex outermembrane receptor protein
LTLYFDLIFDLSENLKLTNKSFYESLNNLNENVYGFSQYAETWVFEDQLNLQFTTNFGSHVKANFQAGPSIRHQDYIHGDNFAGEYFDRRDITLPGSALDRRALATRGEELFSNHVRGKYTDSGIAFLADLTFFEKLNILGGGRYDYIDMTSTNFYDVIDAAVDPINGTTPGLHASDTKGATSWSVSGSYELPFGIRPYVTRSTQSTLVVGQGGQIAAENIAIGKAVAASTLKEYGVKATLFGGRLYTALDYYDQTRVDFNAQDTVTNGATQTKGWEYEARWVVHPLLTLAGAYTNIKVYNLAHPVGGSQFSFAGAADLPGVDPASFYGGTVASLVYIPNREFTRKAGIPENLYSLNAIFTLDSLLKGVTASVGASHVDSVWSGYSKTVKLPSYTLVNAGLHYENKNWKVGFQAKNITDERYFRSNFPDLFGSSVVLPEVPRNYLLSLAYKF